MASATRSRTAAPPRAPQGNLGTALSQFDHSHKNQETLAPGSLSINVPGNNNSNTSQDGDDDRERSLTLGSEFDLGWALGKDGRGMSISGLLTPLGETAAENGNNNSEDGTSTTVVSGSTTSTHNSTQVVVGAAAGGAQAEGAPTNQSTSAQFAATFLDSLPENNAVPTKTADGSVHNNYAASAEQKMPGRTRAESSASTAQFLSELYQQQPQQQQPRSQNQMISHTPPTQMGTSYENSHFGKRMRAGSISGRLRSASDLEDTGVISREQKAILKDLIIAGDSSIQGAIDKYEAGDPSALEEMIKGGALLARSSDVDLLGDLDLDFLNVHGDDGMMFGNMDDIGVEPTPVASNSHTLHPARARGNSVDDLEVHRMRANSLALPGFLLDGENHDDQQMSFGRWMDKHVAGPPVPHALQMQGGNARQQQQHQLPSNSVDADGSQDILHPAPQYSSECDTLMASKFRGGYNATTASPPQDKKPKAKKEKKKTPKKEKKEKKEPRERKSQSKMKDMMENMSSSETNITSSSTTEEGENKEVQSGLGRPRSMSDPNLSVRLDDHGLLHVEGPDGWVGAYSPDSRQIRINRFLEKRSHRVWIKKVKYDVRKNFADSRLRVKGRFVKKEDEMLMRELMSLT